MWHTAVSLGQSALNGIQPVLAQVLHNRGIRDWFTAQTFLTGQPRSSEPLLMSGMAHAVDRLIAAVRAGEHTAIYGDYDADGVTSTALLYLTLSALGARVTPFIPDRAADGYGLHSAALRRLHSDGVRLVVTVDCGIRSVAEVADAKRAGLDLIVTDHHEVGAVLPAADALVNPRQPGCPYPEKMLAGVGVAYRLAQALLDASPAPWLQAEALLDLVAIGTVADLMPLDHAENRSLVRAGLERIRRCPRPGVKALLDDAGVYHELVDARSIAFSVAPRLNAAGRMASADLAFRLLVTSDPLEAHGLAVELSHLNRARRAATAAAFAQCEIDESAPVVFVSGDFLPGIVGLVAAKLAERYARPAFVVTTGADGLAHGSARAGAAHCPVNIVLDACADLLTSYGGHAGAGGFALPTANLPLLRERLYRGCETAAPRSVDLAIDAILDQRDLTDETAEALELLEPVGSGNPAPLFCSRQMRVIRAQVVGSDASHLSLRLVSPEGVLFDAIAFGLADRCPTLPACIDVAYHLNRHYWRGARRLQLEVVDFREADRI